MSELPTVPRDMVLLRSFARWLESAIDVYFAHGFFRGGMDALVLNDVDYLVGRVPTDEYWHLTVRVLLADGRSIVLAGGIYDHQSSAADVGLFDLVPVRGDEDE